jgi:septal ring factor EnvC (AmiA/AmiB activator)
LPTVCGNGDVHGYSGNFDLRCSRSIPARLDRGQNLRIFRQQVCSQGPRSSRRQNSLDQCAKLENEAKALKEEQGQLANRDKTIENLTDTVRKLKSDLKESVIKTNELRGELSDRAAENIKSEVKLRDVETELSIARASTDLIATGVLDYTEEEDENPKKALKSVT